MRITPAATGVRSCELWVGGSHARRGSGRGPAPSSPRSGGIVGPSPWWDRGMERDGAAHASGRG
eukprot:5189437-Prymnesium_polylepis.1